MLIGRLYISGLNFLRMLFRVSFSTNYQNYTRLVYSIAYIANPVSKSEKKSRYRSFCYCVVCEFNLVLAASVAQ